MVKDPFKGIDFSGVRASMPDWKGPLDDLKQLITTGNEVITVINDLAKGRVDWSLIFDLTGFKSMGDKFSAALAPGGFLHKFREFFDAINAHALGRSGNGPGRSPSGPAPAPFVLPNLDQFPKSETAPSGPRVPRLPISPIAFHPDEGAGAAGSSSRGDAVGIIAAGTRRGVLDGMTDFWQMMKGLNKGGAGGGGSGVTPASYEPDGGGHGGPGGGPGGREGGGGGIGGGGAGGRPGAPGSPAGRIGHAVRHGRGGSYVPHGVHPTGGGGTPTGNEAALAKQGYDYWRSQGLTHDQALSVLGNERGENPLGALAVGDRGSFGGHATVGQFQWDPPRRAQILAGTGIDVATAGFLDQQKAARWEMEHSPDRINRVWDRLKSAKTREEQVGVLVHNYERSADQPRDIAKRMGFAARYAKLHLDKATVASMPARPVTPTPSGYDRIRARLKAVEAAGIKAGQEEWQGTSGSIHGEPGDKKQFTPWDKHPWGHLKGPGETHDILGRPLEQQASLRREPGALLRASNQMQANASATHKVQGEASLRIKLASGLAPDGGVKNKGSLFKEVRLDRAPLALAGTTG